MKPLLALVFLVPAQLVPVADGRAQQASSMAVTAAAPQTTGGRAFLVEAGGGFLGSLAGFTLARQVFDECETENISCYLSSAAATLSVATAASAASAYVAGRIASTDPSGPGATLGAIVGAAAGVGAWHLAAEDLDLFTSEAAGIMTFAITQGIFAGLGSRIARAID